MRLPMSVGSAKGSTMTQLRGESDRTTPAQPNRRDILRWGGTLGLTAGLTAMLGTQRPFTPRAAAGTRPAAPPSVPESQATTLWYPAPADETKIVQQGLPIGNGRLAALVGGDPSNDFLYLTDGSMWLGDR